MNAYIVFDNEDSVTHALVFNNTMIGEKHIRVDRCGKPELDYSATVFVGNLPFGTSNKFNISI
jgi:hypothetical protein